MYKVGINNTAYYRLSLSYTFLKEIVLFIFVTFLLVKNKCISYYEVPNGYVVKKL